MSIISTHLSRFNKYSEGNIRHPLALHSFWLFPSNLENYLKAIRQICVVIHPLIHFPGLRNIIISREMKTGRRTGSSSPPWMKTETSGSMWRNMLSQQSKRCPRYPKFHAETEQQMQTCLKKGFHEHKCHTCSTCIDLLRVALGRRN